MPTEYRVQWSDREDKVTVLSFEDDGISTTNRELASFDMLPEVMRENLVKLRILSGDDRHKVWLPNVGRCYGGDIFWLDEDEDGENYGKL